MFVLSASLLLPFVLNMPTGGVTTSPNVPSGLTQASSAASAQIPTAPQYVIAQPPSPPERILDIAYKLIICIIGIGGSTASIWVGAKYCRKLIKVLNEMSDVIGIIKPDLPLYKKMAERTSSVIQEVLPDILQGFTSKKICNKSTECKLTTILNRDFTTTPKSPTELSETGKFLLLDSKMKDFVDANLEIFIDKLESLKLQSALDVEPSSLVVIREKIEGDANTCAFFKDYVFQHPDKTQDNIFYVGSIYLRNKFFENHQEFIRKRDDENLDFVNWGRKSGGTISISPY